MSFGMGESGVSRDADVMEVDEGALYGFVDEQGEESYVKRCVGR